MALLWQLPVFDDRNGEVITPAELLRGFSHFQEGHPLGHPGINDAHVFVAPILDLKDGRPISAVAEDDPDRTSQLRGQIRRDEAAVVGEPAPSC